MFAKERLYFTSSREALVREGNPKAAFLYAAPGDEIPESAAERFGLVNGALPDGGAKERKGGGNKEKAPGEDKGGDAGGAKSPEPGALTSIKGIGAATAKNLVAAGIADTAALALVDPAAPPAIEKLPPNFDWAAVVALAKAAQPAPAEGGDQ
jgi:predicted flap endonuclease-1-like 5' DNA nuclease